MTKTRIIILFSLLAFGALVLSNCKKKNLIENDGHSTEGIKFFASGSTPFNVSNVTFTNNMLVFTTHEALSDLEDEIEDFNLTWASDTNTSADTGYIAFENQMSFTGLRNIIEAEETALEAMDNLFDYNDPDDHFIIDDFWRTILNEDLEFGVGVDHYKFINEYTMIEVIDDYNTFSNFNGLTGSQILPYLVGDNVNIETELYCDKKIVSHFIINNTNGNTIQFTNKSINGVEFFWDFGDGNTSTLENPSHTYASSGSFEVTLVIMGVSGDGVEIYDKNKSTARTTGLCMPQFECEIDQTNSYQVTFTDHSVASSGCIIVDWLWDFGDGNISTQEDPVHTYASKGFKTITLWIRDDCDCYPASLSEYASIKIYVGGDMTCVNSAYLQTTYCKYTNTNNDKYKVKVKTRTKTNYRTKIVMKTKHYILRNNGSKKRNKAKSITAKFWGAYNFGEDCTTNKEYLLENGDQNTPNLNKKKDEAKRRFGRHDTLSFIKAEFYLQYELTNNGDGKDYESYIIETIGYNICK